MPKLPQIRARRLIRALGRLGFQVIRQTGGHVQLKKGNLLVTVPNHPGDLNPETLRSILRQSQVSIDTILEEI
jgi:predicted RNA binding protein YcfA (HicA-like mRNA interferase family)